MVKVKHNTYSQNMYCTKLGTELASHRILRSIVKQKQMKVHFNVSLLENEQCKISKKEKINKDDNFNKQRSPKIKNEEQPSN